jgi:hypothetical protein
MQVASHHTKHTADRESCLENEKRFALLCPGHFFASHSSKKTLTRMDLRQDTCIIIPLPCERVHSADGHPRSASKFFLYMYVTL